MNDRKKIHVIMLIGVLIYGLTSLAVLPTQAPCQDFDRDGYLDSEEESGVLFSDVLNISFENVDKEIPDAFVILSPASGSLLPLENWHEAITAEQKDGGLGLNVHVINASENYTDRFITSRQKAGKITEDTFNAVGDVLGWCQQGTFNDEDNCIIFTARIVNHIKKVCGSRYGTASCKDDAGNYGDALVSRYVTWAMVHELGHSMTIERCYIEENGGNHSPAGSGYIMDQSVVAVDKQGKVTFTIPKKYSAESQSAYDLAFEKDSSVCEVIKTSKKK